MTTAFGILLVIAWSTFKGQLEQEVLSNTLAGRHPVAAQSRPDYIERVFGADSGITDIPDAFRGKLACDYCCQTAGIRHVTSPPRMLQYDLCGLSMHLKYKYVMSFLQSSIYLRCHGHWV